MLTRCEALKKRAGVVLEVTESRDHPEISTIYVDATKSTNESSRADQSLRMTFPNTVC